MRRLFDRFDRIERWMGDNLDFESFAQSRLYGFLAGLFVTLPFLIVDGIARLFRWNELSNWVENYGVYVWLGLIAAALGIWFFKVCADQVNPKRRAEHMRRLDEERANG